MELQVYRSAEGAPHLPLPLPTILDLDAQALSTWQMNIDY